MTILLGVLKQNIIYFFLELMKDQFENLVGKIFQIDIRVLRIEYKTLTIKDQNLLKILI